jgi:hypothetical protein
MPIDVDCGLVVTMHDTGLLSVEARLARLNDPTVCTQLLKIAGGSDREACTTHRGRTFGQTEAPAEIDTAGT